MKTFEVTFVGSGKFPTAEDIKQAINTLCIIESNTALDVSEKI